jgi:hypothetical protein
VKLKPRRGLALVLEEGDILTAPEAGRRLFLGRFDAGALRQELERTGVLGALAERGYPDVELRTGYEAGEHRLAVVPPGQDVSLVELRLVEGACPVGDPLLRSLGLDVLSFLGVQWLALQHPGGAFTAERPRLPGQRYPGLGIGKLLFQVLTSWAAAWGKDGLLNFPEYFHNARFYAPPFCFLSPGEQGRFEALCRDLAGVPVAEASAAVEEGRVLDPRTGTAMAWEPGEMVMPLTPRVAGVLRSQAWRAAVSAAAAASRFTVRGAPAPARRP